VFKIIKKLINFSFIFFLFIGINHAISDDKIYLDLQNLVFENKSNYKNYQTNSQLVIKTDLKKEIEDWTRKKIILKGKSGKLTVKILDESIIDSAVEEHRNKFSFLPKNGIAYKINFKIKILGENLKNNSSAEVLSIVKGEQTFLGGFSINDRSKVLDELMGSMIKKLKKNINSGINAEFKDFLTNKYN